MLDAAERIPDPEERIAFFINSYTKKLMAADAATRVLVHENRRLKPAHQEKIKSVWRRVLNLIRDAFSEMEAMGKIRRTNKTFAAFAALGMCSWTFYWFDYDRKQSAQELADTYVQILLKGLKKECWWGFKGFAPPWSMIFLSKSSIPILFEYVRGYLRVFIGHKICRAAGRSSFVISDTPPIQWSDHSRTSPLGKESCI